MAVIVTEAGSPKKKKPKLKTPHQWKHGSIVRVRPGAGYRSYEGINATVLKQNENDDQVLIQFDRELPGLHDGHGDGVEGRCWFLSSRHILHYFDAKLAEMKHEDNMRPEPQVQARKVWRRGTLVHVKRDVGWNQYINIDATVLMQRPGEEEVLIQFSQEMPQLHDGDGQGRPNRCLYVGDSQIMSYFRAPTMAENIYGSDAVVSNEEAVVRDEEPVPVEEGHISEHWPNSAIKMNIDEMAEEYDRKKSVGQAVSVALDEGGQTSREESELEEIEEDERPRNWQGRYKPANLPNTYSTGKKISIKPKPAQLPLVDGQLCKVQKANGDRTAYDNIVAIIVTRGKFGRFLLQFDQRIPNGHSGKGLGERGRCKWFYGKDVASISMGEAIAMGDSRPARGGVVPKKSRRPKPNFSSNRSPVWKPSGGLQPDQSSDSMWDDEEEVPAVKKARKKPLLSPTITSGGMTKGARVIVHSPPSDNKALRGQKGVIISDSSGHSNVTVQFDKMIIGCHDANGHGKSGRCWNLHKTLLKSIDADVVFYIKEDYKRGNKNLKDMEVKILAYITHPTSESLSVVEFTEEIPQGHSADGKGRKAHCLSVPTSIVGKRKKEKPKEKAIKKPHEVKAKKEAKEK